jgi:hypothetical protein
MDMDNMIFASIVFLRICNFRFDPFSVLKKRAAHTKCDFWVWDMFPTSLVQKLAQVRISTLLAKY